MLKYLAGMLAALLLAAGCTAAPNDESAHTPAPDAPAASSAATTAQPQTPTPTPAPTPEPPPPPELPGGGRDLLPNYRLCGFVGHPHAPGQGRLGIGVLEERMVELHAACAPYATDRKIMPVMELIAVTVQPHAGADGMWRVRTDPAIIDHWLATARANNAMLLLNIQPGQASFIDEVRAFENYLIQPDVGVALDPEWAMDPGEIPMVHFGSTTGAELDEVARYLADLVATHDLPDKVMLYHILHPQIITDEAALQPYPRVIQIKSVDGIGSPGAKIGTYNGVAAGVPPHVMMGFKLFYEEDVATSGVLMSPAEVLAIVPTPVYVLYE